MATDGFKSLSIPAETHNLLRELGEFNGQSMSEVITDLAKNAADRNPEVKQKAKEYAEKMQQIDALRAQLGLSNETPRVVRVETIKSHKRGGRFAGVPGLGYARGPEWTVDTPFGTYTAALPSDNTDFLKHYFGGDTQEEAL